MPSLPASLAILIPLAGALIYRNPHHVFRPTLYAEDGRVWFEEAWNYGLASLFIPHAGYLNVYLHLVALAGRLVPLRLLPAWFVIAGALMQLAPVALMLHRGQAIVASAAARWALILFYLAMPNSQELYLNLTDSQWHLALVSFLLLVLEPPQGRAGRLIQYGVLLVGGLSGPYALFLAPIAWWQLLTTPIHRRRHALIEAALLSLSAAIQALYVLRGLSADRSPAPLGASPTGFARILTDQVFLAGMIGKHNVANLQPGPLWQQGVVAWMIGIPASALLALAFWRCRGRAVATWRKFTVFGALILASSLSLPVGESTAKQWQLLDIPGIGCRYFFFAIMVWFSGLLLLGSQAGSKMRFAGCLLPLFLIGAWGDWYYHFPETNVAREYSHAVKQFARTMPGVTVRFPEDPPGWTMELEKR